MAASSNVKKQNKFLGFFKRIGKFFRECKGELRKISWPTLRQTTKNFGVVLAVMVIIGLFVFLLDWGLFSLLGLVMETSSSAEAAANAAAAATTTIPQAVTDAAAATADTATAIATTLAG